MPRLSLTQSEMTLVRNTLQDYLIDLDDGIAEAEDEGYPETAESLRRTKEMVDSVLVKVARARA